MTTVGKSKLVVMQATGQVGFVQVSRYNFVRHLPETTLD